MKFSKNLQDLRNKHNLSQEQLADKIGVSRQSIGAWESGKTLPEIDKLADIAKVFGVNAGDLLGELPAGEQTDFAKDFYDSESSKIAALNATGVATILAGIAIGLFRSSHSIVELDPETSFDPGHNPIWIILGVVAALPMLISAGLKNDIIKNRLKKSKPQLDEVYSDLEIEEIKKRKSAFVILGVCTIVASVAATWIARTHYNFDDSQSAGVLIAMIAAGVWSLIFGAQNDKIEKIVDINREKNPKLEKFYAILWTSTTGIYLISGFLFGTFSTLWVVFPIAAVVTALASIIFDKKN